MLQFVLLRRGNKYEKFRETCLKYANNLKVFATKVEEEQVTDQKKGDREDS